MYTALNIEHWIRMRIILRLCLRFCSHHARRGQQDTLVGGCGPLMENSWKWFLKYCTHSASRNHVVCLSIRSAETNWQQNTLPLQIQGRHLYSTSLQAGQGGQSHRGQSTAMLESNVVWAEKKTLCDILSARLNPLFFLYPLRTRFCNLLINVIVSRARY